MWYFPDPSLLLEMKINSFPDRAQDNKKTKDLADICALLLYSETTSFAFGGLKGRNIARSRKFESGIRTLPETEWDHVSRLLDEDKRELKRVDARSLR